MKRSVLVIFALVGILLVWVAPRWSPPVFGQAAAAQPPADDVPAGVARQRVRPQHDHVDCHDDRAQADTEPAAVTVECADDSGNLSTTVARVTVPQSISDVSTPLSELRR